MRLELVVTNPQTPSGQLDLLTAKPTKPKTRQF